MMKRHIFTMIMLVLCLSLALTMGCAKKAVVKDDTTAAAEQKVAAQATPEAPAAVKEDDAAARAAAEKAAAEEAARQKALAEEEMRQRAAREAAEKEAALFGDVNFDYDKYTIKPEYKDRLKDQADWLKASGSPGMAIEGHCDERGTSEYNMALGQRRADAAKKYLADLGVDKKKIKTVSYGKERPLDPGHNEDAWAKNRRAHFVVNK